MIYRISRRIRRVGEVLVFDFLSGKFLGWFYFCYFSSLRANVLEEEETGW